MTSEELMQPRWIKIARYPNDHHPIGHIFTNIFGDSSLNYYNGYPALFKALEWWEHRTVEEMPAYVKLDIAKHPYAAVFFMKPDYYPGNPVLWDDPVETWCQHSAHNFLPATEEEYNDYIKSQQP